MAGERSRLLPLWLTGPIITTPVGNIISLPVPEADRDERGGKNIYGVIKKVKKERECVKNKKH